jgi:hypothetical protein
MFSEQKKMVLHITSKQQKTNKYLKGPKAGMRAK